MSASLSQSPATSQTVSPASPTSAVASSAASNSATQDAAGLSQTAPSPVEEGGLAGALAAVGDCAGLVLDVLPIGDAFELAAENLHLRPVVDWVLDQAVAELFQCADQVVAAIQSSLLPAGWFASLDADCAGVVQLGGGAQGGGEAGGKVSVTESGLWIELHGIVEGGGGAAAPGMTVYGANGDAAGAWADAGITAGSTVLAAWSVDFATAFGTSPTPIASVTNAGEDPLATFRPALDALCAWTPDECTVEIDLSTACNQGVSLDSETLGGQVAVATGGTGSLPPGIAEWMSARMGGNVAAGLVYGTGYAEGSTFVSVAGECGADAAAMAGEHGASVSGAKVGFRLTLRGFSTDALASATPFSELVSTFSSVELTFSGGDETNVERETLCFDNAYAALAAVVAQAAGTKGEGATIGDLVVGREHRLERVEGIEDLLPWKVATLQAEVDNGYAYAEVVGETTIDAAISEDRLRAAGVVTDDMDEERGRDLQRQVAAEYLGERNGDYPVDELVELRRAEVSVSVKGRAGGALVIATDGLGAGLDVEIGREVDLADELAREDVVRLLQS